MRNAAARRMLAEPLTGERGIALVLVLLLLALISILGTFALSTSSTEVGISGNYRTNQEAVLAADRAAQYAMTDGDIFNRIGTSSINLNNDPGAAVSTAHVTAIAAGTSDTGLDTSATNEVRYLKADSLPPGQESDPTFFQARYYAISVTGKGRTGAISRIDTQVARVVPK